MLHNGARQSSYTFVKHLLNISHDTELHNLEEAARAQKKLKSLSKLYICKDKITIIWKTFIDYS